MKRFVEFKKGDEVINPARVLGFQERIILRAFDGRNYIGSVYMRLGEGEEEHYLGFRSFTPGELRRILYRTSGRYKEVKWIES